MERRRRTVGRYVLLEPLASGGMATVHLGRLRAEGGFSRLVAIKVLHAQFAQDPGFREMFLDEARIVSRIRHVNVGSILDVLEDCGELFLVMEYIDGLPLSEVLTDLAKARATMPLEIAAALVVDILEGLRAVHDATSDVGEPLRIVHRDVSPHNIMVGRDGLARVLDFGIACAEQQGHLTTPGQIKGKAAYMPPEQAQGLPLDGRADLYSTAVVFWELITGRRLFAGEGFADIILRQIQMQPPPPSTFRPGIPADLDALLLHGLAKKAAERFSDAGSMIDAINGCVGRAPPAEVARWVGGIAAPFFRARGQLLAKLEMDERSEPNQQMAPQDPASVDATMHDETVHEGRSSWVNAPRPKRRTPLLLVSLGALAAAGSLGVVAVRARTARSGTEETPVTKTEAIAVTARAPLPTPAVSEVPPLPLDAPASSAAATPARNPRPRARPLATAPTAPLPAASKAPPAAAAERPSCCVGGIQIRFSGCEDNCAK